MSRSFYRERHHIRGRVHDQKDATARRSDVPVCEETGKRVFTLEVDVHLAFRGAPVKPRAYRCPHCHGWHGTQLRADER